MKKLLHMFLACMMLLACATTAFASVSSDSSESYEGFTLAQGDPIGSIYEQDGVLLEDAESRANGLPFSMRANGVTGLLTTSGVSGKNFTGNAFSVSRGEGLLIEGTVTHTDGCDVRVGACSYQPLNGLFFSALPLYFPSGVRSSGFIPKSANYTIYFNNELTYYGHITNNVDYGSVAGNLYFSKAARP